MKEIIRKILQAIVEGVLYAYCKIICRAKIEGRENIPIDGSLIFCGNHTTYLDPILIKVTAKRDMNFMAKEELYHNKFFAFLGWIEAAIPVKRDSKDVTAIKTSLKILKNGGCIGLFPEGTRNGMEKGQEVKDGAAFLAVRTGAKIVPAGIHKDEKSKRIVIKYGKPLDFNNYDKNDKEALDKITDEVMKNIIELAK